MLAFTAMVTMGAALLFGVAPAVHLARESLNGAPNTGRNVAGDAGLLRAVLVASQVGISVILLVAAGLLVRSLIALQQVALGFRPEQILTAQVTLPSQKSRTNSEVRQFGSELLRRVEAIPEVESVGISSVLPLGGADFSRPMFVGNRPEVDGRQTMIGVRSVSPSYFRAVGIAAKRGRLFSDADSEDAAAVAVVNEVMAKIFWPNEDPVGTHLGFTPNDSQVIEVVGVAGDVRHRGPDQEPTPEVYFPFAQQPTPVIALAVRAKVEPSKRRVRFPIVRFEAAFRKKPR